jgi:sec-independent protein translocase protein TatB
MFGLGWGEMVVIGIVALIAIGPKELPAVLRTIGHWVGKVRRMANEFQGQFQEALREAELTDLQKHADDVTKSVSDFANQDPLAETQRDLEKAFADKPADKPAEAAPAPLPVSEAIEQMPMPLPEIEVPLPEPMPEITERDFAPVPVQSAEAAAPEPAPKPKPKRRAKKSGGGA